MPIVSAIENALDTHATKISWKDIAVAAGITKSALSHFKGGTELKFPTLMKIAKFIYKDSYMTPLKSWCLTLEQPVNMRYALEFLALNRHTEELQQLINKIYHEHPTRELTDWANAYSILLMYRKGVDVAEIINELRVYTPKSTETKVLATILEIYCKNKTKEYHSILALSQGLDLSIEEISDSYFKESFGLRLKEILAHISLYRFNDPLTARKYANEIISSNLSANLSTDSYYIVGMSYLFDSYDDCLGNIIKYQEKLIRIGKQAEANLVSQHDLPFVKNVWNMHNEQPETNDISELAHYHAKMGDKELALELIEKAIAEQTSGFKLYYKALATNDMSLFMQSLIFFVSKKGDKFFANLPYQHLKSDPTYAAMADMLFID
jgi:hypothetical protein